MACREEVSYCQHFYCISLSTTAPGEGPGPSVPLPPPGPLPPPSPPPGPTTGGVGAPGTSSGGGAGKSSIIEVFLTKFEYYITKPVLFHIGWASCQTRRPKFSLFQVFS